MSQLINLTPHTIALFTPEGVKNIAPSGKMIRAKMVGRHVGDVAGMPLYETVFDSVEGVPFPQEGEVYIISALAMKAMASQGMPLSQFVAPGTGPQDGAIRDGDGRVVGITRFVREVS